MPLPGTFGLTRRRLGLLALACALPACAARQPAPQLAPQVPSIGEASARFEREWARAAGGPPELRIQLAARPLAFFRFVNRAWTREVCQAFADQLDSLPTARLHGDAHVEQYAVSAEARGLDDFDDSSRGPAVVDITRFIGSLELAAEQRGWMASLPAIVDAFFAGYRQALDSPSYLPPDPAIVARLRSAPVRSVPEFFEWTESLMEPLSKGELTQFAAAWPKVEVLARRTDPEATPAFLRPKSKGWLHMGIGSALTRKLLIRIEGPSVDPDDDLILEAKEVGPFEGGSCVSIPKNSDASRVVEGIRQIGRLPQRLLVALPGVTGTLENGRGWWVKTWDRTFVELGVVDLASPDELREVAHDVGAQLGSSNLLRPSGRPAEGRRRRELEAIARLEPRMRQVAHDLTVALTEAWARGR